MPRAGALRGRAGGGLTMWGIIPAAGSGTRIQPLAFSKELLPVGSRSQDGIERPRAVSEYLVDRMLLCGAGQALLRDLARQVRHPPLLRLRGRVGDRRLRGPIAAAGLCDAIFRAAPLVDPAESVLIGLPDTIWFPEDGLAALDADRLSFLLFPVDRPELFDAVATDADGRVREIWVKSPSAGSAWVWGAMRMPGAVLHEPRTAWRARERRDEYLGTLVNAWLRGGGVASGIRAGTAYVDVGTLNGYRAATELLQAQDGGPAPDRRLGPGPR